VTVVDADVLIDALERGREPARLRVARLLAAGDLAVTAVTVYELTCGGTTTDRALDRIRTALAPATVLPVTRDAAYLAAAANRYLEARGQAIATPDTLVAGVCLEAGLPLLTRNVRHFERVPGLRLEPIEP